MNRRVVELLAEQVYAMELEGESRYGVWSLRKAAWAIEDLEQDLGLMYRTLGLRGLRGIQNVGPAVARKVAWWLEQLMEPEP